MNRDALLATIIGFIIGLVITSTLLFGPNLIKAMPKWSLPAITLPFPKSKSEVYPKQPQVAENIKETITLRVDSPQNEYISDQETLMVSGLAPKGSIVIAAGMMDEQIAETTAEGKYALQVTLIEGINEIVVSSFENGLLDTKKVTVYYTPEKF